LKGAVWKHTYALLTCGLLAMGILAASEKVT